MIGIKSINSIRLEFNLILLQLIVIPNFLNFINLLESLKR